MRYESKALTSRMYQLYGWYVDKVDLEITSDPNLDTTFEIWNVHDIKDKETGKDYSEFQVIEYTPKQISTVLKGVADILERMDMLDDEEVESAKNLIEKIHNIS